MFGNECCLSTGEVIKIIGLKIKKIIAEICEHIEGCERPQPFELPMNFPGTVNCNDFIFVKLLLIDIYIYTVENNTKW